MPSAKRPKRVRKLKIECAAWVIEVHGPPSEKQVYHEKSKARWSLVALTLAVLLAWLLAPEAVQAVLALLGK